MRTYAHANVHIHTYVCERMRADGLLRTNVCGCRNVYVHAHACVRANAFEYVCMQCVCAHTRMCVHMHTCDIWCEQTCMCEHAGTGACPCACLHMQLHVRAYHVFGYTSMCATVPYVRTQHSCACMFAPMCTYQCVPAHCHICVRTLMHLQMHTCVCTRTPAHAYVRMHVQCCANLHKCMQAHKHVRVAASVIMRVCTRACACTFHHICTVMGTCAQAQTLGHANTHTRTFACAHVHLPSHKHAACNRSVRVLA